MNQSSPAWRASTRASSAASYPVFSSGISMFLLSHIQYSISMTHSYFSHKTEKKINMNLVAEILSKDILPCEVTQPSLCKISFI